MLINKTRKKKISSKIVFCRSMISQAHGLMFRSRAAVKDCAWIFVFKKPRRESLTMSFVFFPIDVIFLDEHKKVVELKENFKSWHLYTPKSPAKYIIELDHGLIKRSRTRLSDRLAFKG